MNVPGMPDPMNPGQPKMPSTQPGMPGTGMTPPGIENAPPWLSDPIRDKLKTAMSPKEAASKGVGMGGEVAQKPGAMMGLK